jgi:hypothetical protein
MLIGFFLGQCETGHTLQLESQPIFGPAHASLRTGKAFYGVAHATAQRAR